MAATIARGVRAPIIREGDDIVKITADCVEQAMREDGFSLSDRDVVAVTEAVVARAAGNYATVQKMAGLFREKYGSIVCRELLGAKQAAATDPAPSARTADYYAQRPCARFVAESARIAGRMLKEEI